MLKIPCEKEYSEKLEALNEMKKAKEELDEHKIDPLNWAKEKPEKYFEILDQLVNQLNDKEEKLKICNKLFEECQKKNDLFKGDIVG